MDLIIYTLSNGDCVHRYCKSLVVSFCGERKVLSTSPLNGGYQDKLTAVFNNDGNPGAGMACKLRAQSYEEHMKLIASELGLEPEKTAGIGTAASMDNVSIKTESYEELTVTAIVTGGVEVNGGRAGDPSSFSERSGKVEMLNHGTINIMLVIDANLSEGTMARALVTCTEAKTAALQELMAGSNYSSGLATGSGTDGTIIISNPKSGLSLTNTGKHSKLGELIGLTVKAAVKEALFLQTGLCPNYQHSILKRMKRYGINEEKIWLSYKEDKTSIALKKPDFIHRLHMIEKCSGLVTITSLLVHILDQLDWGLLEIKEAKNAGEMLLDIMKQEISRMLISVEESLEKKNTVDDSCRKDNLLPQWTNAKTERERGNCGDIEQLRSKLLSEYTSLIAVLGGKWNV